MNRFMLSVAFFAAVSLPLTVQATSCDSLGSSVDDARLRLRRALMESNLEEAKDLARKARNALDDAASAAEDCKCQPAYQEFDDAARYSRRARDADSSSEFAEELNRSIRSFNSALQEVKRCLKERR